MKNCTVCLWLSIIILLMACKEEKHPMEFKNFNVDYPDTRMDKDVSEDYHGNVILDPFRWLEDDNSEETIDWVDRQNKVTFSYLDSIPYRSALNARLTKLWNYEKIGTPFKEGDDYYYLKNDGLQNQSVLYAKSDLEGDATMILDPNKLSDDGTSSLGSMGFSMDGRYMAYQVSEGGSDWRTVYIKDLKEDKLLDEKVEWIKFSSISWAGEGFYYGRYPSATDDDKLSGKNEFHKLYYHKLGTDQDEDRLVYEDNDHPQRNIYATTTTNEDFLVLSIVESTSGNAVKIKNLKTGGDFEDVVEGFDHDFSLIDEINGKLVFITNHGASKQRIIAVDPQSPSEAAWQVLIPESDDALRSASIAGDKLFASYLHDASSSVKVFDLNGKQSGTLELPGIGTTSDISGDKDETTAFYSFSSFTRPTTIYKLNTETFESTVYEEPKIDFDTENYVTVQEWYTSKDGTRIPMFITHKKGLAYDGKRPTMLYGYGGFDIPLVPSFSISRLPIIENDGIYVVANIRGGGEFGSDWHKAGTLDRKQNVFDDFITAAEFLIDKGYTSSEKLAIEGRSNGGLLVGACMTQRPDLYAVAFPGVGVLDMLRYHKFTIGWAWATDYGRSDDPDAFNYLIKYSPLHNVKPQPYPATMVTTADHDDRVVPAHSFKYIAELQRKHQGENPVLIRIDKSAGHGAGKPTSKRIEEVADLLSFMFYNMKEEINY